MTDASSPVFIFRGHLTDVQAAVFLARHAVASGDASGEVKLWDVRDQRTTSTCRMHDHQGGILQLAGSDQCGLVSQGRDGLVKVWDLENLRPSRGPVSCVALGSYGFCRLALLGAGQAGNHSLVAAMAGANTDDVEVWDLKNTRRTHCLSQERLEKRAGMCMAVCPVPAESAGPEGAGRGAAQQLLAGYEDGSLALWDLRLPCEPLSLLRHIHSEPIMCLTAAPSAGQWAVASGSADDKLLVTRPSAAGSGRAGGAGTASCAALAGSSGDAILAGERADPDPASGAGSGNGDRGSGTIHGAGSGDNGSSYNGSSDRGSGVGSGGSGGDDSGSRHCGSGNGGGGNSNGGSGDGGGGNSNSGSGKRYVGSGDDGQLNGSRGNDCSTGGRGSGRGDQGRGGGGKGGDGAPRVGVLLEVWSTLVLRHAGTGDVAVRHDGRLLAAGGWDGKLRLYGWKKMRPLAALQYHTAAVTSVAFSADAALLATASRDCSVAIWAPYPPN